eukprot:TRINITY_DN33610_c0_g1_i1.p1 TRINITY_DN33610_c0_g1~~TRINITY_DN33610_c0_g1_i1.p1  ORF type:complete len:402 (+),score=88.41 TRINITY_DN33610_c0_g1_i1:105-1310(+)
MSSASEKLRAKLKERRQTVDAAVADGSAGAEDSLEEMEKDRHESAGVAMSKRQRSSLVDLAGRQIVSSIANTIEPGRSRASSSQSAAAGPEESPRATGSSPRKTAPAGLVVDTAVCKEGAPKARVAAKAAAEDGETACSSSKTQMFSLQEPGTPRLYYIGDPSKQPTKRFSLLGEGGAKADAAVVIGAKDARPSAAAVKTVPLLDATAAGSDTADSGAPSSTSDPDGDTITAAMKALDRISPLGSPKNAVADQTSRKATESTEDGGNSETVALMQTAITFGDPGGPPATQAPSDAFAVTSSRAVSSLSSRASIDAKELIAVQSSVAPAPRRQHMVDDMAVELLQPNNNARGQQRELAPRSSRRCCAALRRLCWFLPDANEEIEEEERLSKAAGCELPERQR